VHRLTFYNDLQPGLHLPRTEEFARRELTLPLHPRMMMSTVEFVVNSLAGALGAEFPLEAIA
jgi:dTDP-4-amino-4,6-dideoxygalactose transaminase